MKVSELIQCNGFPCEDVRHECYVAPDTNISPEKVSIVMVSEAAPDDPKNYYYTDDDSLFAQTTVQAFQDAGADVASVQDILNLGVYLTTAVKCGKTGYGIKYRL